ncbi:hypothetical protein K2X33_15240 [bacterium]|nr:hypothetical protein [bacterium]
MGIRRLKSFFLGLLALWGAPAQAYYVLAFDIYGETLLSAIAVFADPFGIGWEGMEELSELLAESYHPNSGTFVEAYLTALYGWYFQQIAAHPEIYGTRIHETIQELMLMEPIFDGLSSTLVLTEFRQLNLPLASIRVALTDKKGFLPFQNHWKGRIEKPIPPLKLHSEWHHAPLLQHTDVRGEYVLGLPFSKSLVFGPVGARAEFKTTSFNPLSKRQYDPDLYAVSQELGLFYRGSDGAALTDYYSQAYGPIMARIHRIASFEHLSAVQGTENPPISIRSTTASQFEQVNSERLRTLFPNYGSRGRRRMVFNPALTRQLRSPGCAAGMGFLAFPDVEKK